jgi:hypothetical protein
MRSFRSRIRSVVSFTAFFSVVAVAMPVLSVSFLSLTCC